MTTSAELEFTRDFDPTLDISELQTVARLEFPDPGTRLLGRFAWLLFGLLALGLIIHDIWNVAIGGPGVLLSYGFHELIILIFVLWVCYTFFGNLFRWVKSGFRTELKPGPAIDGYTVGRQVTRLRQDGILVKMARFEEVVRWPAVTGIRKSQNRIYFITGEGCVTSVPDSQDVRSFLSSLAQPRSVS